MDSRNWSCQISDVTVSHIVGLFEAFQLDFTALLYIFTAPEKVELLPDPSEACPPKRP